MKRLLLPLCFVCLLSLNQAFPQTVRQFGTTYDNAFTQIIQNGLNTFVLGSDQPSAGAPGRATVSRLGPTGNLLWTRSLNIPSVWNDAVATPNGNLLLVGATMPQDASARSLMGLLTPSGTFTWVQAYDAPGREAFTNIERNFSPQNSSFPYYVLGFQNDSGSGLPSDDVVLLTANDAGSFGWKKTFPSSADDGYSRDLEVFSNGDLLISGNTGDQGVLLRTDNAGILYSGATPEGVGFVFADAAKAANGGVYAVGYTSAGFSAYLMKFDGEMLPVWEANIGGLTDINEVLADPSNNLIFITATGVFNGKSRTVVLRYTDTGDSPVLDWVKFLDNGETSYGRGSIALCCPAGGLDTLMYADRRVPASGGFGQVCAFFSKSDLDFNTCITVNGSVSTDGTSFQFAGPLIPESAFYDVPQGMLLTSSLVTWQQQDVCTAVCFADFLPQNINGCGLVQFNDLSSGSGTLSYSWDFGDPTTGTNNTSNLASPTHQFSQCGIFNVSLTVSDNGCSDTKYLNVNVFDITPPLVICPQSQNIQTQPNTNGDCAAVVNGLGVQASDNCQVQSVVYSSNGPVTGGGPGDVSGANFGVGTTSVTYVVTDWCGNISTCLFTVNVSCPPPTFPGFECGQAFVTCYSLIDPAVPDGYSVAMVDVRDAGNAPLLQNWAPPSYHHPDWKRSTLGEVFGLAMDENQNVYVSATKIYAGMSNYSAEGVGGAAGVYQISATTGSVTMLTGTNINSGANTVGTNQMPNDAVDGPGLGNLCYDELHKQLFVSNFEDGRIYRIAVPGNTNNPAGGEVLSRFDPFTADDQTPGPVCLGDRLFGVGVYGGRLYFGRWMQHTQVPGSGANEIWSVAIDPLSGDYMGSAVLEITLPPFLSFWAGWMTSPVSDIEFSRAGNMLVVERGFVPGTGCFVETDAHNARVLEYTGSSGNWNVAKQYYVGNAFIHTNASGGADYGYSVLDPASGDVFGCDQLVWATGDALIYDINERVYGLAGMPAAGNGPSPDGIDFSPLQSTYIDLDGETTAVKDKRGIGDVDIFKCDCMDTPCICGTFSNMSVRWGGAPNQPISCGGSVTVPGGLPLVVYADFQCDGDPCLPPVPISWKLTGPPGAALQSGNTSALPNFTIQLSQNSFIYQGTYTLTMEGYCGVDTCACIVEIVTDGVCCQDPDYFDALINDGFTIENDGCNVVAYTTQFLSCDKFGSAPDWGDGSTVPPGPFPSNYVWTHTYTSSGTYNVCVTVEEDNCFSKTMCTPVTVVCDGACSNNLVQNGTFNDGIPDGFDESILLADHWGSIWPDNFNSGISTGDFFNTTFAPPIVGTPQPVSQGNHGGFWCTIQGTDITWREGIMNELLNNVPKNSGCYELSFKLACTGDFNGAPILNMYGVTTTGLATGTTPVNGITPPNLNLFPAGDAVQIATYPVPNTCNANFQTLNFVLDASLFPAGGINHIFFTRSDNMTGAAYLSIDDVCLRQVACYTCCGNYDIFEQTLEQNVTAGVGSCEAFVQIGSLPDCNSISGIVWGDGSETPGPFGADTMITHTYTDGGTYTITWTANETAQGTGTTCFQKTFSQNVDVVCSVACGCGGFSNMVFKDGTGTVNQAVSCNDLVILTCQPGANYKLTGNLSCLPVGLCPPNPLLNWYLREVNGPVLVQGLAIPTVPFFQIDLPSAYFSNSTLYELVINGLCGGAVCECVIQIEVPLPCPNPCPCNITDLAQDVAKGFIQSVNVFNPCKRCFYPRALSPCDSVVWKVGLGSNPPLYVASKIGNQAFCYTFPQAGTYTIQFTVIRRTGPGLNILCGTATYSKTITVSCSTIPLPLCNTPKAFNPDFGGMASPGVLGDTGASEHWVLVEGTPRVDTAQGSSDGWVIELEGHSSSSDAIRSYESICLEKDSGTINIGLRSMAYQAGEQLVVRFIRGDVFLTDSCDMDTNCLEIARIDLPPDADDWSNFEIGYNLSDVIGNDTCGSESLQIRPVVHVTNNSNTSSRLQIDYICLEGPGSTISLKKPLMEASMRIYPNPNGGAFTIELTEPSDDGVVFRITDLSGRLVMEVPAETGKIRHGINMGDMPSGMYTIQAVSVGRVWAAERFVKR
ncbi:MAG: PKD domain-containing protein [Saprospiraceae bacterium]|nr:PKD domain-containing protein [Saprospiraceae bacterium]